MAEINAERTGSIVTGRLHNGFLHHPYEGVLRANTRGQAVTWKLTAGQLPRGLQLNASTGKITGTPAEVGRFAFSVAASNAQATSTREFTLQIFDQPLDPYGGLTSRPCAAGQQEHFYVEKSGNRWLLCTPDGNGFWLQGVSNIQADSSSGDQGVSYAAAATSKYGDTNYNWSNQISKRLLSWGFNAAVENTSAYMFPFGRPAGATLLPLAPISLMSRYALTNDSNFGLRPVKSLLDCLDTEIYTGWIGSGSTPDVFDPNYEAYVKGRDAATLADPFWSQWFTSPWVIGITFDDSDELFGIGPGPEHPGTDGVIHPHIGWIALAASPVKTHSPRYGQHYVDPRTFSKRELVSELMSKYATIEALNQAWQADYTTFGTNGGWPRHSTGGSGLLDEDGSSAWLGASDGNLEIGNTAVKSDLDTFLLKYWRRYFSITRNAFKAYSPKQLFFSPALNSHGGISRKEILQAAGEYCDVLAIAATSQAALDISAEATGDKPYIFSQVIRSANPDSSLWRYPNPYGQNAQSQAERAANYAELVTFATSTAVTSTQTLPFVGFTYWAFADSWGEKANWGLVTFLDNAYDGVEAVPAAGVDSWGFPTGGEERAYGAFLTRVQEVNFGSIGALANSARMPTGRRPRK